MNIDPNIWGSNAWKFMHYITIAYPIQPNEEIKKNAYNFFMSLKYLLPCEKCRYNFGHHLQKHPLTNEILSSRDLLIDWLIGIHNDVNIDTGKPILIREQILKEYMNPIENKSHYNSTILFDYIYNTDNRILTIFIVIILLLIIMIILHYYR